MDRIIFDMEHGCVTVLITLPEVTPLEMAVAARSILQREISRLASGGEPELKKGYLG